MIDIYYINTIILHAMTVFKIFKAWKKFWRIVWLYEAYDELDNLIEWANRKKLYGVKKAYTNKWMTIDYILFKARTNDMRRDLLARRTYQLYKLLNGNTGYQKGYASKYKSQRI